MCALCQACDLRSFSQRMDKEGYLT